MSDPNKQLEIIELKKLNTALAMLAKAELLKLLNETSKEKVTKNEILGNIDVMNQIIRSK